MAESNSGQLLPTDTISADVTIRLEPNEHGIIPVLDKDRRTIGRVTNYWIEGNTLHTEVELNDGRSVRAGYQFRMVG